MFSSAVFIVPSLGFTHLDINLMFFTNWGFNLTELALLFSLWASKYSTSEDSMFDYKLPAIYLNEVAHIANIIIASVFFTFIWFGPDSNYGFSTLD